MLNFDNNHNILEDVYLHLSMYRLQRQNRVTWRKIIYFLTLSLATVLPNNGIGLRKFQITLLGSKASSASVFPPSSPTNKFESFETIWSPTAMPNVANVPLCAVTKGNKYKLNAIYSAKTYILKDYPLLVVLNF